MRERFVNSPWSCSPISHGGDYKTTWISEKFAGGQRERVVLAGRGKKGLPHPLPGQNRHNLSSLGMDAMPDTGIE
jgi:hypothetical protein